jgi:phage replication-related protein YjqB (UPF0714/DUF867 family)
MRSMPHLALLMCLTACAVEVGEGDDTTDIESETETETETDSAADQILSLATDSFACFRPESASTTNGGYACAGSPSLIYSTLCAEGASASWHVELNAVARDMTMALIAPHGGKIEPRTEVIAIGIATELGLPYYAFIGHATDRCLDRYGGSTRSNHRALHITSVHFNDARAASLMRSVNRGVSVHGHSGPNKICVGGITPALRSAFRRYYDTYAKRYSPSRAAAVDAPGDGDCKHIAGTSAANISNRSRARAGLQLELSATIRAELVASKAGDRLLWNAFRNAVRAACRTTLDGVRGCS